MFIGIINLYNRLVGFPDLPIEIIGNIILQAGGIPLLKRISVNFSELNYKIIEQYNEITRPINQLEIENYITISNPKIIYTFSYYNHSIIVVGYERITSNYELCSSCCYDGYFSFSSGYKIFNSVSGLCPYIKEFVTDYDFNNYDLLTTFNIIKDRTNNEQIAKQVCVDTLNFYCQNLKKEILWFYLSNNYAALYFTHIDRIKCGDDVLINDRKEKILNRLDTLSNSNQMYQYSNYAIQKVKKIILYLNLR